MPSFVRNDRKVWKRILLKWHYAPLRINGMCKVENIRRFCNKCGKFHFKYLFSTKLFNKNENTKNEDGLILMHLTIRK